MNQGESMISDTLSSIAETPTLTSAQTQNENASGQDEFIKKLQELQSQTNQHKHVQEQLLANRQEKTVQTHEKTDEQLDLERDEQRKINRHGGYSITDLRRGVDMVESAGVTPEEQYQTGSESLRQNRENPSQTKFLTESQNPTSSLPEPEPSASEKNTDTRSAEPQNSEFKPHQNNAEPIMHVRAEDKTAAANSVTQTSAVQTKVSLSGMTPVISRSDATVEADLETKIAASLKQIGDVKGKHDNTITKEAVTSTSDVAPQQERGTSQHTGKETAASQMFPQTSLVDRVDQAKLTQRITNVFRSLGNQDGTVRMKLHPEELGAITLRMKTEDGKVSASIEAETETAKNLLLDNLEQLRSKLAEQNIQLDSFEVEVRSDFQQNFDSGQNDGQERSLESKSPHLRQPVEKMELSEDNMPIRQHVSLENHHIDVIG